MQKIAASNYIDFCNDDMKKAHKKKNAYSFQLSEKDCPKTVGIPFGGAEGQPVLVTKFSREYIYSFRNRVSMPFDRSE